MTYKELIIPVFSALMVSKCCCCWSSICFNVSFSSCTSFACISLSFSDFNCSSRRPCSTHVYHHHHHHYYHQRQHCYFTQIARRKVYTISTMTFYFIYWLYWTNVRETLTLCESSSRLVHKFWSYSRNIVQSLVANSVHTADIVCMSSRHTDKCIA